MSTKNSMLLSEVSKTQVWGFSKGLHATHRARSEELKPDAPVPPKFGQMYSSYDATTIPSTYVRPKSETESKFMDDNQQIQSAEKSNYIFGNKTAAPKLVRAGLANATIIKEGSGHFIGGKGNEVEVAEAVARASRFTESSGRDGMMGVISEFGPDMHQQIVIPESMRGSDSATAATVVRVN